MAKMTNDAYTRENTKGKVSMSGEHAEVDAAIAAQTSETQLTGVKAVIAESEKRIKALSAELELCKMDCKDNLLAAMEQDPDYAARCKALEDFTIQWCTSIRSKGTDDPDFVRSEEFDGKVLYAYAFDIDTCTYNELVTCWNSADHVVAELRKKALKAKKAEAERKKREEAERIAKQKANDELLLKMQSIMCEQLKMTPEQLLEMLKK